MNRPTALLVVAWLWIIIGIFTIAFGVCVAFQTIQIHNILDEMDVTNPMTERIPDFDNPLLEVLHIAYVTMFVVFALGVFMVISGFYLLKLRAWARLSLEILSWLGLIYYMFNFIRVVKGFTSFKSNFLEVQETYPSILFYIIIGAIIGLIFVAALIVSIILLRGKSVREAVKRRDTLTTSTDGGIKQVD